MPRATHYVGLDVPYVGRSIGRILCMWYRFVNYLNPDSVSMTVKYASWDLWASAASTNCHAKFQKLEETPKAVKSTQSEQFQIISLSFFNARTLTTLDAGLALIMISSPVAGFRPGRSFVAGLLWT